MNQTNTINGLREVLGHLETCLQTPIVSGELAAWVADAQRAIDEVGQVYCQETRQRHEEIFAKISSAQPGLQNHVDELRQAHERLQADYEALKSRAELLAQRAKAVEPDEGKLNTPVQEFINQGLAFVVAARKQDTGVSTWLHEALSHDEGTGD